MLSLRDFKEEIIFIYEGRLSPLCSPYPKIMKDIAPRLSISKVYNLFALYPFSIGEKSATTKDFLEYLPLFLRALVSPFGLNEP